MAGDSPGVVCPLRSPLSIVIARIALGAHYFHGRLSFFGGLLPVRTELVIRRLDAGPPNEHSHCLGRDRVLVRSAVIEPMTNSIQRETTSKIIELFAFATTSDDETFDYTPGKP